MARERITLVSDDIQQKEQLRSMIESGEINPGNFNQLNPKRQEEVNKILFEIAANQINLAQGVSAIEFVLFSFIRLSQKKMNGLALTVEDKKIKEGLEKVLQLHEICNEDLPVEEWLFDYMEYAKAAAVDILDNREQHIKRKKNVTGQV